MAHMYRPREYFHCSVAKLSEQSWEQSKDNSVDISRKDLDDHNQLSSRVRKKAPRLGKMWKRACHVKNQRSDRENEKRPPHLNLQ